MSLFLQVDRIFFTLCSLCSYTHPSSWNLFLFPHIFKRIFEVSPRINPRTFNSLILILWNIYFRLRCIHVCVYFFSFFCNGWRLRMRVQKTFNAFSRRSRNICLRNSNFSLAQRPDTFFARVSLYYQDRSRWKQANVIINCFWQFPKGNEEGKKLWFYAKIAMFMWSEFWDKTKSESCKFRWKFFLNIFRGKKTITINSYHQMGKKKYEK